MAGRWHYNFLYLSLAIVIICFTIALNRHKFHAVLRDNYFNRASSVEFEKSTVAKENNSVFPTNTPKTKKKPPVLILFWSTYFGSQVVCDKPIRDSKICNNTNLKHCSTPCEITADRKRAAKANVMIIHARDPHPLPPAQYSHIPLVLFTWENPVYSPMLSKPDFVSKFNYLMSYRPDLADFFVPTMDTPSIEPKPFPFEKKSGLIAAVFSHCESVRTAYLKELMKHIQVDSYGSCLRNNYSLEDRYEGDFKQAKIRLLRKYKFTIVFLNQDCDYFVDDQLTHALNAGTIPVYMGTDKVDELLGGNLKYSIIKVRDFESPKKLAEYLKIVSKNKALYNKYLTWKYEGFQLSKSFLSTPQGKGMEFFVLPQYCEMCATIAASRQTGQFKRKGLIKPEYCNARKVEDSLPKNHDY